jgi:hypothetical protein
MTTASRQPTLRSQAHLQGTQSLRRKSQPCKRACLHPRRPSYISLFIFNLLAWGLTSIYGQTPNNLTVFKGQNFIQQQNKINLQQYEKDLQTVNARDQQFSEIKI